MRKIDSETIKIMNLFESVTGARLKDCIVNQNLLFIVHPGQIGIAIGKNGKNIRKVESLLKRKSIVKEFSDDKVQFVKNLLGLDVEVADNDGYIEIKCKDHKTRNMIIGRDREKIKFIEKVAKRHFDIKGMGCNIKKI